MNQDQDARPLAVCRILVGTLFLLRTTPLLGPLDISFLHDTAPLLGWPQPGWRIALCFDLADWLTALLCVVRTAAAVGFVLGIRARLSGLVAGALGYLVLSQDALGLVNSLHLLFLSTLLLASTDAGTVFALVPDRRVGGASGTWLLRTTVASIYFWSGIAKLHGAWWAGETLRDMMADRMFSGPLAPILMGGPIRQIVAARAVLLFELGLGPLLFWKRSRRAALVAAWGFHAALQLTVVPDFFGFTMSALLLMFLDSRPTSPRP